MKLRKASLSDISDLQSICTKAYSENFFDHWVKDGLEKYLQKEFNQERLHADLRDDNTDYYFIEYEMENVGFVKLYNHSYSKWSIEDSNEVEKIYVLPGWKGLGIGKSVMMEIIRMSKEREKINLLLCVIDTNESAISFYKKLGFEYHSKTILDIPLFKEELKGMHVMVKKLSK